MISVVVPTIDGREGHLDRCLTSYAAHTEDYELIVVPNKPTCGIAWIEAAEKAQGEYLHFSADDLEAHAGWWQAAVKCVNSGKLPACKLLYPDGRLQAEGGTWEGTEKEGQDSAFTRVPFLSRKQYDRIGMIPTHYCTDNWISARGRQLGIRTVMVHDYLFTHHFAAEGRVDDRLEADLMRFNRYLEVGL